MRRTALLVLSLAGALSAQAIFRVDPSPVMTTSGTVPYGGNPALYAVANATIQLCTDTACATPATAYTDAGGLTACPSYAPVTWPGTTVCTSTTGAQGQFGFWLVPGTYYYRVTLPNGTSFGNYPITSNTAGVTNLIAGAGIGVSAGTGSVTITNTGVVSFNGRTGPVTPAAGDYPVSLGGTGFTSAALNGFLFGNGTNPFGVTVAGTQYEVAQAGAGGVPTVGPVHLDQTPAVMGLLPLANGGTGASTQPGALSAILGGSPLPIASGGSGQTSATAALAAFLAGSKQGNAATVQMAGTNSGVVGATLCNDASGNATTAACATPGLPSGIMNQHLRYQPNVTPNTLQFANLPTLNSADHVFPAQQPTGTGGVLSPGNNVLTWAPVPLGTNGTDTGHYVYVSGGVGTAEACLITGGMGTAGSASGQIIIQCANTHSGAWTVTPTWNGVQEAVQAACTAGGGTVDIPSGAFTIYATLTIPCSNVTVRGNGIYGTAITRTGDFGDSVYAGSALNNIHISGFTIDQTINYAAGPPPTVVNKPTSGAHIHIKGCNSCSIRDTRLTGMPYGIDVDAGAGIYIDRNQITSVWDYANAAVQIGVAGILLHRTIANAGMPTYTYLTNNSITGPASASRSITLNGNTITHVEPVGPQYGVWVQSCEVCSINDNNIEWMDYHGIYLAPPAAHAVSDPLLEVVISRNFLDYNRTYGIEFNNAAQSTAQYSLNVTVADNIILGSGASINGIHSSMVLDGLSFPSVWGFNFTGNFIENTLGAGIYLRGSERGVITGNSIYGYNYANSYPLNTLTCVGSPTGCTGDRIGNSGIFLTDQTNKVSATGNYIGGSLLGTGYNGTSIFTTSAISIGVNPSFTNPIIETAPNFNGGVQAPTSRSTPVPYDPAFLVPVGFTNGAAISSVGVAGCGSLGASSTFLSGTITSATTGTCTPVLTFTNVSSLAGWACSISNRTTANLIRQTASTISSVTFEGTTVTGDVLSYSCAAY